MPEATLQASIVRRLKSLGCYVIKVHQTGRGRRGIPDLIVCHQGRFFAFEVKQPGEKPTPLQIAEMRKIDEAGGIVHVVTSPEQAETIVCHRIGSQVPEMVGITRLEEAA